MSKKEVRAKFRNTVYKRDKYSCRACGAKYTIETAQEQLDAHHITNRNDMPNGGYVLENGISLCKNGEFSCHKKAELRMDGLEPEYLYAIINSSKELAIEKSKKLK